ncbi:MAG: hypothetical protein R6X08_00315 [Desulfosalsimonadaceae bacterium]
MSRPGKAFVAALIFLFVPAIYCNSTIFGDNIIRLKNGQAIETGKNWRIGDKIFYTVEGRTEMVSASRVAEIINGKPRLSNIPALMGHYFFRSQKDLLELLGWTFIGGGLAALYLLSGRGKKKKKKEKNTAKARAEQAAGTVESFPAEEHLQFDFALDIVRFFLDVFKYQTGSPETAPAHITSGESNPAGRNYTYKLHVQHSGRWKSRRMNISPIGEKSRSKSTCYLVVYDARMVVKIPPRPLTDFHRYMQYIEKEKQIADKIAPRHCLVPSLASILRRIYKFPDEAEKTREQIEHRYRLLLEDKPELKRFVTINGSHVYFMDVARYYFLGPVLSDIHDRQTPLLNEMLRYPEILWDMHGFYGRYGTDADAVRKKMIEVYETFLSRLAALEPFCPLDASTLRERGLAWLLKTSAGVPAEEIGRDLPAGFRTRFAPLLREFAEENAQTLQSYRAVVQKYLSGVLFVRNRPRISSLITSLLDLLAWTGEKGVAIRDLKPDNLSVAGDPDKYPMFLNSAKDYALGLIDLETAVDFRPQEFSSCTQPLLGGTLFYATPSHFLPNKILQSRFHDIRRIFYLQDWFAAVAIIFEVITGAYLFRKSAGELNKALKTARKKDNQDTAGKNPVLQLAKREFWETAQQEFDQQCKRCTNSIQPITAAIPLEFQQWLAYELETTVSRIRKLAAACVQSMPVFLSSRNRQQLLQYGPEEIAGLIKKLENPRYYQQISEKNRDKAVSLLCRLQGLRNAESLAFGHLHTLAGPVSRVPAQDMMEMMFLTVHYGMLPEQKTPKKPGSRDSAFPTQHS